MKEATNQCRPQPQVHRMYVQVKYRPVVKLVNIIISAVSNRNNPIANRCVVHTVVVFLLLRRECKIHYPDFLVFISFS